MAGFSTQERNLTGSDHPERIRTLAATPELFDVSGGSSCAWAAIPRLRRAEGRTAGRHPDSYPLAITLWRRSGRCGPASRARWAAGGDRRDHATNICVSRSRDADVGTAVAELKRHLRRFRHQHAGEARTRHHVRSGTAGDGCTAAPYSRTIQDDPEAPRWMGLVGDG